MVIFWRNSKRKNSDEKENVKEKKTQISENSNEEQGISSLVSPDSLDYQGVDRGQIPLEGTEFDD